MSKLFFLLLVIHALLNACDMSLQVTRQKQVFCIPYIENENSKNVGNLQKKKYFNVKSNIAASQSSHTEPSFYSLPSELILKYFYITLYTQNNESLQKFFKDFCMGKTQYIIPMPRLALINKTEQARFEKEYSKIVAHYLELHFFNNISFLMNFFLTKLNNEEALLGHLFTSVYQLDAFFNQYKDRAPLKTIIKNEIQKKQLQPYIIKIANDLSQYIEDLLFNLNQIKNTQGSKNLQSIAKNIINSTQSIRLLPQTSELDLVLLEQKIATNTKDIDTIECIINNYQAKNKEEVNNTLSKCKDNFKRKIDKATAKKNQYNDVDLCYINTIQKTILNIDNLFLTKIPNLSIEDSKKTDEKKDISKGLDAKTANANYIFDYYQIDTNYNNIHDLKQILEKLKKISLYKDAFNPYEKNLLLGLVINAFADHNPISYEKIFIPDGITLSNDSLKIESPTIIQHSPDQLIFQQAEFGLIKQNEPSKPYQSFDPLYYTFVKLILGKLDPQDIESNQNIKITDSSEELDFIIKAINASLSKRDTPILYQMKLLLNKKIAICNKSNAVRQLAYVLHNRLLKNIDLKKNIPKGFNVRDIEAVYQIEPIITNEKVLLEIDSFFLDYIYQQIGPFLCKPIKVYTENKQHIFPLPLNVIKNAVKQDKLDNFLNQDQTYYMYPNHIKKDATNYIQWICKFARQYKLVPFIHTTEIHTKEQHAKFYYEIKNGVTIQAWHPLLKTIIKQKLPNIKNYVISDENYDENVINFLCTLFERVTLQYTPSMHIGEAHPANFYYQMPNELKYLDNLIKLLEQKTMHNLDWSECTAINVTPKKYKEILEKNNVLQKLPENIKYILASKSLQYCFAQDKDKFFDPVNLLQMILAQSTQNNILTFNVTKEFMMDINKIIKINPKKISNTLGIAYETIDAVYIKESAAFSCKKVKTLINFLLSPSKKVILDSYDFGKNFSDWIKLNQNTKTIVIKCSPDVNLNYIDNADHHSYFENINNLSIVFDWSECTNIEIDLFLLSKPILKIIRQSNNVQCTINFSSNGVRHSFLFNSNDNCKDIIIKNNFFNIDGDNVKLSIDALEKIRILFLLEFDEFTIVNAFKEAFTKPVTQATIKNGTCYESDYESCKLYDPLMLICKLFPAIQVDTQHTEYFNFIHKIKAAQSSLTHNNINKNIQLVVEEKKTNLEKSELSETQPSKAGYVLYYLKKIITFLKRLSYKMISVIFRPCLP
ncbi:hypothetical protein EKK58_03885 [Candidatus Dependentiae bacterium]|nr:MAG: hypothetical protein EKK58_03885 [Candidatus Dependentiae bacterium]